MSLIKILNAFFIHSSVDVRLGCFHVLAFVNSVAMNTGVSASFQLRVFARYMPRSRICWIVWQQLKKIIF